MSTCRLCETSLADAPVVGTKARGNRSSRRVACPRCGLVQVAPQPSAQELLEYYRTDYHREHGPVPMCLTHPDGRRTIVQPDEPGYPDAIAAMHRYRAERVIADLGLQPGARVLEIGCSDGRTLAELQARGMDVYGIEPDPAMVALARERVGVNVLCGTVEDAPGAWCFDAVIAFHVLEHIPDPLGWLRAIRDVLRPGGMVWFEVPNTLAPHPDLEGYHWQWVHLFDFTRHTIVALLARAGLDVVDTRDQGIHALQAWATDVGDDERVYVDHDGPNGEALAAHLRRVAASGQGGASPLQAYIDAAPDAVRAEWDAYVRAVHRLGAAYGQARDTLGALSERLAAASVERLESWHPDPYVYGHMIGEAHALHRASALFAHEANGMRIAELSDGEREAG